MSIVDEDRDENFGSELEAQRWKEASQALKFGERDRAIALFKQLAELGDWRAAAALGFIFESQGPEDRNCYVHAAHWYSNALAKEERPEPHLGLARYYCYGLGGRKDYLKALEHLENASAQRNPEAALMLATLLAAGVDHIPPDIPRAKQYYEIARNAGYPLAMSRLSKIAFSEGRWITGIRLGIQGFILLVKLRLKDGNDPKLIGFLREG